MKKGTVIIIKDIKMNLIDLTITKNNEETKGSLFGGGSNVDTEALMFTLTVPIYAGGAVSSKVRETLNLQYKAKDELEQALSQAGDDSIVPHLVSKSLIDAGAESQFDLPRVRDQRTLRISSSEDALAAGRACRDRFEEPRWRAFEADVGWFRSRLQSTHWHAILRDDS